MSDKLTEAELQAFNNEIAALDDDTSEIDENAVIVDRYLTECDLIHVLYGNLILPSDCRILLPIVFKNLNSLTCFDKEQLQNLLIGLQESIVNRIGLYWQSSNND